MKDDEAAEDDEEEVLPKAQMTLTLYSVYEMDQPYLEAE